MDSIIALGLSGNDLLFFVCTLLVATIVSLSVFLIFFFSLRREQRSWQKQILEAITHTERETEGIAVHHRDLISRGELIARFKVGPSQQVVSVLESEGRRFIHVVGELTSRERTTMVRYLKSEGFMS